MGIIRRRLQVDSANRAGFSPFFPRFEKSPAANLFRTRQTSAKRGAEHQATATSGAGRPAIGRVPRAFFLSPGVNMNFPINPLSAALSAIESMASQAAGGASGATSATGAVTGQSGTSGAASVGSFADALKSSINKISDNQTSALKEAHAFEIGAPNVSLNDVMVDMQKANVGLQFGLQVRNKLVSAYNDIMQISV
jgi:flagellar hook-basal body complex protein FliE